MRRRDFLKLGPRLGLAAVAAQFVPLGPQPREPQPLKPIEVAEHQKPLIEMYPRPVDGTRFLSKDGLFEYRRPECREDEAELIMQTIMDPLSYFPTRRKRGSS